MLLRIGFLILCAATTVQAAELRGKVVNQGTGQPLSTATVVLSDGTYATKTDLGGAFRLSRVPAGKYTLKVETSGFWSQQIDVEVGDDDVREFAIALVPKGPPRSDKVEVTGDVFGGAEPAQVALLDLTNSELKETDTVFAGDLFRSIQTMPGVTGSSNNDFFAQFMVLGADFSTVAMYVDDVLVRQPFHGISGSSEGASIGVINEDTVSTLSLVPLAFSERYAEGTGGALNIRTREGLRDRTHLGVGTGMAETHVTAEGALPDRLGSWLISGRKSYLGYLTRNDTSGSTTGSATIEPSFSDLTSHLTFDLAPRESVDLLVIGGLSNIDNSGGEALPLNNFFTGNSNFSLVRLGWRGGLTPHLMLAAHTAFTSQAEVAHDQQREPLERSTSAEWVVGNSLVWEWRPKQSLEAGWTFRRVSGQLLTYGYSTDASTPDDDTSNSGTGTRQGAYVQQNSALFRGRMQIMGGVRWDTFSKAALNPVSPQSSGSLRVAPATSLLWGLGRYTQFPEVAYASVECGVFAPLVTTSDHYLAGVEQKINDSTRFRIQAFDRTDHERTGLRGGQSEWNAINEGNYPSTCGAIASINAPTIASETRLRTHGAEIILQRRSSDRLSGWLAYTFLRQRETTWQQSYTYPYYNGMLVPLTFDGDGDQKNGFNAFGTYRLRPTLNLSSKFLYGSGYPVLAGYGSDSILYVNGQAATQANTLPFLRVDARVDKAFDWHDRKVTLHAEVLNLTNHHNMRFAAWQGSDGYGNWAYFVTESRTLGFTPTAGIEFHF